MDISLFNEIPIGTLFQHPGDNNMVFVKFANAIPKLAPHQQSPNSFALFNKHYFSLGAKSPVIILKEPDDFDDTKLHII